jgi:hypothetical protein
MMAPKLFTVHGMKFIGPLTRVFTAAAPAQPPYDPGVALLTTPGGTATVTLERQQHGERLYRLTGAGLYRDSVLTGAMDDIPPSVAPRALAPVLSGSIGQDTVPILFCPVLLIYTWLIHCIYNSLTLIAHIYVAGHGGSFQRETLLDLR